MNNNQFKWIRENEDFIRIMNFIDQEKLDKEIYPPKDKILYAIDNMKEDVKVVIIGQDPYHNPDQANGLSFSVGRECKKLPPSLKNIYKELESDIPGSINADHGDLSSWSEQGVLLLNTSLSVEKNKPNSHSKIGWTTITDRIVKEISDVNNNVVFILWGANAKEKISLIDTEKHLILSSSHPSPFSCRKGFFGSKPFSTANNYLISYNKKPINWSIK